MNIDTLIKELLFLKKEEELLIRITGLLSSYFTDNDKGVLKKNHEQCLKNLLEKYYQLIYKKNEVNNEQRRND